MSDWPDPPVAELSGGEIRRATPGLSALMREGFEAGAALGFLAPLTAARLESFWAMVAAEAEAGRRVVLVAGAASDPVGTVQLILDQADNGAHRCELAKLAVSADSRGSGAGRLLVAAAEAAAARLGRPLVELTTHADTPAVGFYEHLGYVEVGRLPRWAIAPSGDLVDNVVMVKHLASPN